MPLIIYVTLLFSIRGFFLVVVFLFSSKSIVYACVRSLQIIIYILVARQTQWRCEHFQKCTNHTTFENDHRMSYYVANDAIIYIYNHSISQTNAWRIEWEYTWARRVAILPKKREESSVSVWTDYSRHDGGCIQCSNNNHFCVYSLKYIVIICHLK